MKQIIEQLILLNQRDCLDYISALLPIILTIVLIVQNRVISKRNENLQKQIHNRDIVSQAHEDILRIYRTYYDFCDAVFTSNLFESIRHADVNAARYHLQTIYNMKRSILQNLDLARLLFSRQSPELFAVIQDHFNLEIEILDKCHDYIYSGRINVVYENAWNTVMASKTQLYQDSNKYNFQALSNDITMYNNYVALCKSPEFEEIQKRIDVAIEKHSYENYDKYFEEYLCLKGI